MQVDLDSLPLGLVLLAGVFAPLSGWFASTRSRHPVAWFVLGACTGPFAIALLALAPPGRCPACETAVRGWPSACARCGLPFGGVAAALDGRATTPRSTGVGPRRAEPERPVETSSIAFTPTAPSLVPPRSSIAELGGIRAEPRPAGGTSTGPSGGTAPGPAANPVEQVLSTGLYLSGNAGLEIGATYAIARVGPRLRIFGPVDAGELTVRLEDDLEDFQVTALDDRVIISGQPGRSSTAIIFRAIGGMRAGELEQALGPAGAGSGRTA
ncbi:MAG: hypothetical protein ACXW4T_00835 [Candidatus Limnocylindrales bacterium]